MMTVTADIYGTIDGQDIKSFILKRGAFQAQVIEYGATLISLMVPDAQGAVADVVLGYDTLEGYRASKTYFGVTAGRYGNRIRRGVLSLDGHSYQLSTNEGKNHLHGGRNGFDRKIWRGEALPESCAVRLVYRSPDGEEGYPGTLDLAVTYALGENGLFTVEIRAKTDRATVCNPVHHTYWNLGGHDSGDVLGHRLAFSSDFYTPVDAELLATGEIRSVAGTPFDFRSPKTIGADLARIENPGGGLSADAAGGYDHNFVLRGDVGAMKLCVRAADPKSGRGMELTTSEPGVQFYTGGYLEPSIVGKGGQGYCRYGGFTLETQKFPCSPEFGHFPSARLEAGQDYRHRMEFRFFNETR
jgi:aldose 1-epimerase